MVLDTFELTFIIKFHELTCYRDILEKICGKGQGTYTHRKKFFPNSEKATFLSKIIELLEHFSLFNPIYYCNMAKRVQNFKDENHSVRTNFFF